MATAEMADEEFHCGRCGARVTRVDLTMSNRVEWFHTLHYKPVYPDPDGMDWRIGHRADPLPGSPTDRRTAPVKPLPEATYIDADGYLLEPVSYEEGEPPDLNLEGDPAFNGAFDRW
jgi:hypothetical protein